MACLIAVWSGGLWAGPLWAGQTPEERQARIESMDPTEKKELLRRQERFAGLDPAEQERLRQLHDQIELHPRRDELRDVMHRYYEWIKRLPPDERAALRELPPEQRIERVKELRHTQAEWNAKLEAIRAAWLAERIRRLLPGPVTNEDVEGLIRWIDEYVARNGPKVLESLPEPRRREIEGELAKAKHNPRRYREILGWLWLRNELHGRETLPQLDGSDLEELRSQLSETPGRWFDKMPPDKQRQLVGDLIRLVILGRYAHRRAGPPPWVISDEELREYGKLLEDQKDPKTRAWLLSQPPAEQRAALWWQYVRSKWPELTPGRPEGRFGPWRRPGPFGRPRAGAPKPAGGAQPDRPPRRPPSKKPPGGAPHEPIP